MCTVKKELQKALCHYVTDTLISVDTVRGFCKTFPKWVLWMETDLIMMVDIKNRADSIDLSIDHVSKSEEKGKAFGEYLRSKFTQITADNRRAELQKELDKVLRHILEGLAELDRFLDTVEKLAVTSLHVFTENQALLLPQGSSFEGVQVVIAAARLICPLLLEFRRDAEAFFLPSLQNVEVMSYQLDKYIQTTRSICEKLEKSSFSDFDLKKKTVVKLDAGLSDADIHRMLDHVNQLDEIRMNQHFRTVSLFLGESFGFIEEFSERKPRMLQCLTDLEEIAAQLDRMNKGAKISSVAGSSVGAAGGVLSIVGLALIPVTAGISLALTMTGIGMGVTSGVNSMVTTATEIGVNAKQQKKASKVFQSLMEDVQILQDCLEDVAYQGSKMKENVMSMVVGVGKVIRNAGVVGKGIDAFVDGVSAAKLLKNEELIPSVAKVVAEEGKTLRSAPRLASDIPDIGQAVAKGPLALSKSARAGFIALNALFLGIDVFFICKDSISLAKGSETEVSQFIRARSALWNSEIEAWQRIHDLLSEGLITSGKKQAVLETPFYLERGAEEQRETKRETPPKQGDSENKLCAIQ